MKKTKYLDKFKDKIKISKKILEKAGNKIVDNIKLNKNQAIIRKDNTTVRIKKEKPISSFYERSNYFKKEYEKEKKLFLR